jgi:adenylosuccinate synthase
VIGLQWGDEAKGKLVDLLTAEFDFVVRYQGGANAGHTVVHGEDVYKLHHIPSGILSPDVMNIVTGGVVVNPPTILEEIDGLTERGVDVGNLLLSDRSHVVFPWHIEEDRLLNKSTADGEDIGTTLRGIGPCYRDKVGRSFAVRLGDLCRGDFRQKIARIVDAKKRMLAGLNGQGNLDLDAPTISETYAGYGQRLRPHFADTTALLLDAVDADRTILFEGAQGALLDIDHGTYPFVTSSNSSGVGVASGAGVPGQFVKLVIGVIKCYSTRVGGGPFPTEQDDEHGEHIRQMGNEYGTTTGRPRRCGWFDAVAVRYTARLSGVNLLSVMMLDVLSQLPVIQVCVAYEIDGHRTTTFPSHVDDLRKVTPVYEQHPGWERDITEARSMQDLPPQALQYLERICELVGRPVGVVSVGADREQTIFSAEGRSVLGLDA